jgi:hypothetical protein
MIILPESDPIGNAIYNYHHFNDETLIIVKSSLIEDEEFSPEYFFRGYQNMPKLERIALKNCTGKVLDVGAGAGCHSLWLQENGIEVVALEISLKCCETMTKRGIEKVVNASIYDFNGQMFDTILLLMNGIGIAASPEGLKLLLSKLRCLLNIDGKIILDSSDLVYLYEQPDGSVEFDLNAKSYYGEIDYQLFYKEMVGKPFSWLFSDQVLLADTADYCGFSTKILEYGTHYDYLAELKLK